MRVISLAKQKGGVSASTTTALLATALVKHHNKNVLIIDADSQKTLFALADLDRKKKLEPIVEVKAIPSNKVQVFIRDNWGKYDIVFLDLPRMTYAANDDKLILLMYLCDSLLIPVVPSQMSMLSTYSFMDIVKSIVKKKVEKFEENTIVHGFMAMANRRSYTNETKEFFDKQGLNMFQSNLDNVKIFSSITLSDSVMATKEGRKRFEPFYNEFLTKYNIV